jgi:four helix bundle protein
VTSSGLERLKVWVEARDLAVEVYRVIIPCLPAEEKWGLSSQLRRSAASVPANIAEGYGRYYYQANVQYCYNARGSLEETISHIMLASNLGYITEDVSRSIIARADTLVILINGYIAYLRKSKNTVTGSETDSHKACDNIEKYYSEGIETEENGIDHSQFSTLDSHD